MAYSNTTALVTALLLVTTASTNVWSAPVQWSGNGHWYEAIPVGENGITWD